MPKVVFMQKGVTSFLIVLSLISLTVLVSTPFVFFSIYVGDSQFFDEFNIFGDLVNQIIVNVDQTKSINLVPQF